MQFRATTQRRNVGGRCPHPRLSTAVEIRRRTSMQTRRTANCRTRRRHRSRTRSIQTRCSSRRTRRTTPPRRLSSVLVLRTSEGRDHDNHDYAAPVRSSIKSPQLADPSQSPQLRNALPTSSTSPAPRTRVCLTVERLAEANRGLRGCRGWRKTRTARTTRTRSQHLPEVRVEPRRSSLSAASTD